MHYLFQLLSEAYQLTKDKRYKEVIEETIRIYSKRIDASRRRILCRLRCRQ